MKPVKVVIVKDTEEDDYIIVGSLAHAHKRFGDPDADICPSVTETVCPELSEYPDLTMLVEFEISVENFVGAASFNPYCDDTSTDPNPPTAYVCRTAWQDLFHVEYPERIYYRQTSRIYYSPEELAEELRNAGIQSNPLSGD